MSTLPGLASKGEKEKSKYQSLDINKLYRVSLGENLEKQQQKSTLSQKHGMQSLGKVPNTRRPPANLPSLKSEHSGTDTAVSLVPSNGSGWGKQESTVTTPTTPTVQQPANNTIVSVPIAIAPQMTAHQAAIALPVTTTIQVPIKPHPTSASPAASLDKSWSSVMIGNDPNTVHPPPYQSPQFQHEFPSLSSGDGVPPRTGTDTQYAPGLSLRPQTEGSWLQGGSRAPPDAVGTRTSSVPQGGPPQLSAPVGQPLPPQVRGFVPNFMYRGNNFPTNGHSLLPPNVGGQQQSPQQANAGRRGDPRQRGADVDELAHRPIIKEEELSGMDNLTGDMGWAINDDIDYNQKLAFSDDEIKADKEMRKLSRTNREYEKTDTHSQETDHKSWGGRNQPRGRHEDDEFSAQRRRQQQEIAHAVERAKQRKEEEEKKFLETRQAAAKKLQELDERIGKSKRDKDSDETSGTINPASVPPQTIAPVPILLPEWEREKDARPKSTSAPQHHENDDNKTKANQRDASDFKQLTQIEGRATFNRKDTRSSEKEQPGGATTSHSFSKQFQNDLPPRFQKQQQQFNAHSTQSCFPYDNRWSQSGNRTSPNSRKNRDDDKEVEDRYRRQDDNYRSHRTYGDSGRKSSDSRYEDYNKDRDYAKDDEKLRERTRDRHDKSDSFESVSISRQSSDEWHGDKRADKYERPQRPDSRDSRTSRESRHSGDSTRHSEPREYTSWAEEPLEEKKKEHRMVVPGPITKEKIEADDLRNEKRNLTQLKRGSMPDKKLDKIEKSTENDEDSWSLKKNKDSIDEPKAWADAIPPAVEKASAELLKAREEKREDDEEKKEKFIDKDDKKLHQTTGRGRSDSQGSRNQYGNIVYRNSWSNKKNPSLTSRNPRGGQRPISSKGQEMNTESEGSADDGSVPIENGPSPKPIKKLDKDEKNKDVKSGDKLPIDKNKIDKNHFIPRGEPSRHGRGGGTTGSFRGGRGGSKRIDTYGPPVKSPFSNSDEKEKKFDESEDDKNKLKDFKFDDKSRKKLDPRKPKSKLDGDISDNSDVDGRKPKNSLRSTTTTQNRRAGSGAPPMRPPPMNDKRGFGGPRSDLPHRQNSSGNLQIRNSSSSKDNKGIIMKDTNSLSAAIADITLKTDDSNEVEVIVDDGGFQEVKNKKIERKIEKPKDDKPKVLPKSDKDLIKPDRNIKPVNQISQQQMVNIPSLMATPINPPPNIPQPQSNKGQFERNRQNKTLPPRFVKAMEHSRMQKAQMQQRMCDDINKVNQNLYGGLKDSQHVVSTSSIGSNAWDKPLSTQLRTVDQELASVGMEACKSLEATLHHPSATDDKTVLDGSKPLNTIIFENTNYKSAPGARNRNEKPRCNKMEDGMDNLSNFNKPIGELLGKEKPTEIPMQLFNKEDSADMKLDFLESEITQITEDKTSKMSLSRSNIATSNNILTADALNMKIQSVKKVWENIPNVMEHTNDDSFTSSFTTDPNPMDPNTAYSKGSDVSDENHDVYSSSPNPNSSNSTTNVCKVKPTQQVAGSAGQSLLNTGTHQPHSNIVGPTLMGHPLSSPPPIQPVIGALGQPPQQYTASQHISYQAGLGSNQYGGIPAPSPPTVLNYSTQQLQQTGLYAPFQIDQSQVMNSQGRSQFSQYSFGLGQTGSSPYSQSMYLQTGQPHAPPNAQPDLYQNMNNYRLPNTGPFGQNQQQPTTVLISSTSNSLMSPSVKPSNQQISAIGTKAGGVGQAYQQQSQQGQQVYIPYDPAAITANYMQNAGVIQRGGPVQNSVVSGLQPSGLQPSSSFYSGSTGGQTGYFQGPASSTLQSQMPQHQTGFGLQQGVFPTHNQTHSNAGMQNYASPYLSGQMQLAAAMSQAQQYRSAGMQNTQYMKNQIGDQGRQQLKSPGSQQQEVLSSVFNSGSQIASPKSRQQMKQPPPQPSPTSQHNKYMYSGMSNQQTAQSRYPTPIQRPAGNYQSQICNVQNNANNSKPHRMNNSNNRATGGRQYYGSQGGNINTQSDKADESKLNDGVVNSSTGTTLGTTNIGSKAPNASVNQSGDKADAKEENCAKD